MNDYTKISMFAETDEKTDFEFQVVFNDNIDVKYGDIYKLGRHYIMCGDATISEHYELLFGNTKASLILTDPPYNVDYTGNTSDRLTIKNDNMSDSDFRLFLSKSFQNAFKYLNDGSSYYIFHSDTEGYNFRGALNDNNITIRQVLIWVKNSIVLGRQDYHWKHEPILYGWKDGAAHNWYSDRKQSTILNFDKPLRNELHPTIKPIDLLVYLIKNSTTDNDNIIDMFGGSGSTLIAAELTNRNAYSMELDPKYVSVIINNYKRLTGNKEELIYRIK